jgi:enolase
LEINSFSDLKKLESFIRKTARIKNVEKFGGDALFALESATLKALAKEQKKQLWQVINPKAGEAKKFPVPIGNAIGGGLHSKNRNKPEFQEFLLIPRSESFRENVETMKSIYRELGKLLKSNSKNDEGAWQTSLSNEEILSILKKFKRKTRIGVDIAASSFFDVHNYFYRKKTLNRDAQIRYINSLIKKFGLFYVEDPLDEEDFSGFSQIKKKALVCGDDLTATHLERLKSALYADSINSMIIKPNQNGSLLELKKIFDLCMKNNIKTVLSHRSGETMDDALADMAFGFQADFIKTGISTKWREVKLDRLIEIEDSFYSYS